MSKSDGISVIVRTDSTGSSRHLVNLHDQLADQTELIVVGKSPSRLPSESLGGITLVSCSAGRFEALRTGVEIARFNSVLFLDDDQVPEQGLLEELKAKQEDAVIIPERSMNRNLVGRLMDLKRIYLEELARENPVPEIPVIPRFYKVATLNRAFERLSLETLRAIVQHEDSVLYNEAYNFCEEVTFSTKRVFHEDPHVLSFIAKEYRYGRSNESALLSGHLTTEQIRFVRTLDKNRVLYNRTLGLNPGIIVDILKAVPYLMGSLSCRIEDVFKGE